MLQPFFSVEAVARGVDGSVESHLLRNSLAGLPWAEAWTIEMTFSTLRSSGSLWHETVESPDISMLQGNEKRSGLCSEKTLGKCVRVVSRTL